MIKLVLILVFVAFCGVVAAQQQQGPVIVSFQYAELPTARAVSPASHLADAADTARSVHQPQQVPQDASLNGFLSSPKVDVSSTSSSYASSHSPVAKLDAQALSNSSAAEQVNILTEDGTRNVTMSVVPIAGAQSHDLRRGSSYPPHCNSTQCRDVPANSSSSGNMTHHGSLQRDGHNITSRFNSSEMRNLFNSSSSAHSRDSRDSRDSLLADHHNKNASEKVKAGSARNSAMSATSVRHSAIFGLPLLLVGSVLLL